MNHTRDHLLEALVRRVHGEYIEMPDLQLTPEQAQRLLGLGERECPAVLECLVESRVLARRRDGRYVLAGDRAGRNRTTGRDVSSGGLALIA